MARAPWTWILLGVLLPLLVATVSATASNAPTRGAQATPQELAAAQGKDLRAMAAIGQRMLGRQSELEAALADDIPELAPIAPPSALVSRDRVLILGAAGPQDDREIPAGKFPLVTALNALRPASANYVAPTIGIEGDASWPTDVVGEIDRIGGGTSRGKANLAEWGAIPMRFAVVGVTPDARIRELQIADRLNDGTVLGGVLEATFADLTIEARWQQCISSPKGNSFGLLRVLRCRFAPGHEDPESFSGFGYRWGIRNQGRGRYDIRWLEAAKVEEHVIYVDAIQGDSYFVGILAHGARRTVAQVVNRSTDNPGPTGWGRLVFDDIRVLELWGDGGSAVTIAGHLGPVEIRGVQLFQGPAGRSHGAVVVWSDAGHGLYVDQDGFTCGDVSIEGLRVNASGIDRPVVAVSGARSFRMRGFDVSATRETLALEPSQGGGIPNGPVEIEPWIYPGWRNGTRVTLRGVPLTQQQVDALTAPLP